MRIQFCTVMPNESVEVMRPHFSQESFGGRGVKRKIMSA
ncbi:hypothetical protein HJ48_11280 [Salmonella enterica subsp. enterica]|uniref:Uncharacterized protein n=1 Tax=Salmonella senftenberg TaxID=28150 RepID=A0A725V2V7_SALSE|nr:hypothetical protein [Salmonella enterica]ECC3099177.1 hypothetical protein [Salmonella enterica subsp. enterica]HAE1058543.1 hypothetical protein [Salmonella enterica subsp. enterica serovar Senftenberg]